MSINEDYYALLGVSPDADKATIEEAYERLAKEVQPNVDLEPTNPERMRELDEAFDVLDDPARRAEYDAARAAAGNGESPPPVWAAAGATGAAVEPQGTSEEGALAAAGEEPDVVISSEPEAAPVKKGAGSLVAGIALLVGGVAAIVAAIGFAVVTLTDDDDGGTVTSSGLEIEDTVAGTGDAARNGQVVTVHYTGTLADGTEFDSSVGEQPFTFTLGAGDVIDGWDEGVQGMKVGGERTLVIPSDLAYGEGGQGPIPPNATLTFDIMLLAANDAPADNPPAADGEEVEIESGLKMIDVLQGEGEEAAAGDRVFIHFTGWLEADGSRFDSSLLAPEPGVVAFTIGTDAPIPGWDLGVTGMKQGGLRRIIVPPELAFGAEGAGNGAIPPGATLIFDMQLVEIAK
jgi:peptidylprolyl isomerase